MTYALGLTGSIGMGKSTTARLFGDLGCAVWDADTAVHRLYAPGGGAVAAMQAVFPDAIEAGGVSRPRLRAILAEDPAALARIEAIVHPLVADDRRAFLAETEADIAVLDIPLLFEGGLDSAMDATVCVSVPPEVQHARVLARDTMSEAQFDAIQVKQMRDAEKRARATWVVVTDTLEHATAQVQAIVGAIRKDIEDA